MIKGKINVNLIDKEKLFVGKKGKYLDIVLIETPNSKYGDYMIKQDGEKGEDTAILGNAKIWGKKREPEEMQDESNDLPF